MANLKLGVTIGGNIALHSGNYNNYAPTLTGGNASGTWSISITGNAGTVTNGVYTSATYSNPSWITSLAWSKITSTPTTLAGYGITDAQGLDADLTAIGALTGTSGFLKKTAANTWSLDTNTYLTTSSASSTYVPYTGATGDVNIGLNIFKSNYILLEGDASAGGYIGFKQMPGVQGAGLGYSSISAQSTNKFYFRAYQTGANVKYFNFDLSSLSNLTDRTYTLPDASGTIALTSNLSSFLTAESDTLATVTGRGATTSTAVTFSGGITIGGQGTGTGVIGNAGFTSNYTGISLNGTLSTSSYNILSSPTEQTLYINRPTGAAIRFREANGADQMVIASGGAATFSSSVTASSFIRSGGTSSQFLKADGSVDSSTYALSSHTHSYFIGTTAVQTSSANQGITGISSIGFVAEGTDSASISTTISGTSTFFDFNLTDDNNNDEWRWRFTPSGATVYNAMRLVPVSNTASNLIVSGTIAASNFSGTSSGTNTGDQTITLTGDVTGSGTGSFATTLANSGVTAGTYNNVTVDAKGRVTSGSNVSYLTSYTETDTLATVTGRGNSTSTAIYLAGGSSTVPALHIRSGGSSWSEGLAVHPSSNDGYALTFYRTKSSYTDQTNTWALGNLGESGNVNHFGLLRKDLTGGVANGQTNAVFTINPNGVFKFGFSPLVGSNAIWHAGNDGSSSGLDADLLDGYHASGSVGANTVVIRDGNGYIYANYINTNIGVDNPSIANFITDNGDGWMRKSTIAHVRNSLGNYGGWLTQAAADPLYVNVTGDSMTGPLIITGSTSGQELLAVNGINGRLFTVTDDLSNSLFSVNTIAGLPVIEAFADNSVKIGPFSAPITINSSGITTPSHGTSANWWTAFNKRPSSIAFSGSSTKTLTLTLGDGSTLTANFNDIDTDTNTDQQTLSISGQTLTISNGNSVTIPSGTTLNGTGFVRMSGTTVSYVTGTSSQFVKADGSLDGSTYVTSSGNVATVGGLAPAQFFNNMGQSHGTRTSFDVSSPSYDFGFRFVQGSTNGPGTGGSQYYSWYIGLGSDYPATGGGSYGAMFAVDRNTSTPYLSVRYNENNNFSSWRKVAAGYADSAGSVAWTNVTSRPTALSQFTNDLGNYGGFLTALPSHTHDDRYYTESESDGRFQPLENQRLSTGNAPTFGDVYVNSWFRNNSNNTGLYNQNTTQHWSSNTNGYWDASSTTTVSAIRLYTGGHVSALRGGLYANNSNQVGIIDSNQAWRVRATTSGGNLLGLWGVVGSTQGSDTFFVDGVNGRLLTVTDDMSDSIFSANTISGLPVIEAFADYSVKLGVYNQFNLVTSGNRVAINSNTVDPNWAFYVTDRTTATSRYTLANPGMGFNLADNYAQLQLYGPSGAYIDFTQAASDYQGRIMWNASKFTIGGAMWGDMYNASGAAYATQSWVGSQGYLTSLPSHSHTWTSITSKPAVSNWNTNGNSIDVVVGMLSWKNYGDNHVIFDASRSTSPTGSAVNNTNPDVNWTGTYPTLMGWNGSNTYGVRVDVARYSDSTGSVAWTNVSSRPTALSQFTNDLGNYGGWITSSGSISGSAGSIAGFNNPTTAATASTIVYRDTSGHITGNYIFGTYANFSSGNSENPTIGQIWTQNTSDNYLRKSTPAHFRSQIIDGYYLSLSGGTVNGNITENGNLTVNGVITENSSIRYKTDIETIPNALSKVLELRGVSFLKIGSEKTELGLIAEEVAQVVPEIVQLDESGRPDAIAYPRLVALLVESIKDLNDQIQKLTAQVNAGKQ